MSITLEHRSDGIPPFSWVCKLRGKHWWRADLQMYLRSRAYICEICGASDLYYDDGLDDETDL